MASVVSTEWASNRHQERATVGLSKKSAFGMLAIMRGSTRMGFSSSPVVAVIT